MSIFCDAFARFLHGQIPVGKPFDRICGYKGDIAQEEGNADKIYRDRDSGCKRERETETEARRLRD